MMFEASDSQAPKTRIIAFVAAFALSACAVDQEPSRYTEALEIPLGNEGDREELAQILSAAASISDDMHVDDVSARSATFHDEVEILDPEDRPSISLSVWIGENDGELVAQVSDLGHRGRVWATFLKGKDVELHQRFRARAVSSIRQQWPDTRSIPVLPSGGIGNPEDLVMVDGGYKIDRAKATTYDLTYDSSLLADRVTK